MSLQHEVTDDFVFVVHSSDVTVGAMSVYEIEGHPVLLARTDGGIQAFEAVCPHAGFKFVGSVLSESAEIECPMHGARFDATSGAPTCGPARSPLAKLPSRVVNGAVEVVIGRGVRDS